MGHDFTCFVELLGNEEGRGAQTSVSNLKAQAKTDSI